MTRFLRFVCPVLSVVLLAAGFILGGLVWFALGLLFFGVLWMVALALRWDWFPLLALFVLFGIAAFGLFLGIPPALLISGAILAFVSWDLAGFHVRLSLAAPEDDLAGLERPHLLRLAVLTLVGGCLCALALTLHLKPSFEWLVILMFFSIWGIGRMVNWLLNKEP